MIIPKAWILTKCNSTLNALELHLNWVTLGHYLAFCFAVNTLLLVAVDFVLVWSSGARTSGGALFAGCLYKLKFLMSCLPNSKLKASCGRFVWLLDSKT